MPRNSTLFIQVPTLLSHSGQTTLGPHVKGLSKTLGKGRHGGEGITVVVSQIDGYHFGGSLEGTLLLGNYQKECEYRILRTEVYEEDLSQGPCGP